jgi:hypothetical protein
MWLYISGRGHIPSSKQKLANINWTKIKILVQYCCYYGLIMTIYRPGSMSIIFVDIRYRFFFYYFQRFHCRFRFFIIAISISIILFAGPDLYGFGAICADQVTGAFSYITLITAMFYFGGPLIEHSGPCMCCSTVSTVLISRTGKFVRNFCDAFTVGALVHPTMQA